MRRRFEDQIARAAGLAAGLCLAAPAAGQSMGDPSMAGMPMPGVSRPPQPSAPEASPELSTTPSSSAMPAMPPPAEGQDHGATGMDAMAGMDMAMPGALGDYRMTRDASGTAWQPDSAPMEGPHGTAAGWSAMVHGYATLVYDDQGGRRGQDKTFVESMLMLMARRPLAGGALTLRGMVSADPLMGRSGYPLLLQTGETANGKTPLTDRQHPHDLFMELAGAYSRPLAASVSGFVYFGLPGEPALGPATYMHRFAGMANPEAPIGHHWLDSTHVAFGVATAGLVWNSGLGGWKLEASDFTGREPNQNRYDLDHPRFDSWSVRLSWNPSPDWSLQVSRGRLTSPEQLSPDVDQDRTTASATNNRPFAWAARRGDWQTTLAWGRDENRPGETTDAFLAESAATLGPHTLFGRAERVDKDELFDDAPLSPLHGRVFTVGKISLGYAYALPVRDHLALDLGGLVSRYALPGALHAAYGADPTSVMLFARLRLR